jgi:hypothetical protein
MSSFGAKVNISTMVGLIFIITSILLNKKCLNIENHFLQTLLFALIALSSHTSNSLPIGTKLKHTLYGTLLFYLISNSEMYHITNKFLYNNILGTDNCPTNTGIIIHAVLYIIILVIMMYLPD